MKIQQLLDGLHDDLVRKDQDKWLPVTGKRRIGKTTNAIENAMWVDDDFDVETQLTFTAEDHTDVCLRLPPGSAAVLDEPVAGLLSFDANTSDNKGLYRAATVIGERNLFHQVLIPSEKRLTKSFREDYTEHDMHVVRQGVVQLRLIADLERHEIIDPPKVLDEGDFPDLPDAIKIPYRKRKTEFVQGHRDTDAYTQQRIIEREMTGKVAGVLKRYGVPLHERLERAAPVAA